MKDTVISAAVKRRELKIWLVCFLVANIINWVAIIKFGTPWYEVFTQVGALRRMGLTVPDTVDLLDRLHRAGVELPLDALHVEECADAIVAALK